MPGASPLSFRSARPGATAILMGSPFGGASSDGTRVFFETGEPLVSSDTDDCEPLDPLQNGCTDVYERAGASTTLVSPDPVGGGTDFGARMRDVSQNGARVLIRTRDALVGGDTDDAMDLYERSGGTTTLISTGSAGGNGAFDVYYGDTSADGSRVLFVTSEQLVASDTDSAADVYERSGGATTRSRRDPRAGTAPSRLPSGRPRATARACSSRPRRRWLPPTTTPHRTSTNARAARPRWSRRDPRAGTAPSRGSSRAPRRAARRCSSRPPSP